MKKILLVLLLLLTNTYALMVGKYQIFPYQQISNSKQYLISLLQNDIFYSFEAATPAYTSAEKVKSAAELETEKRNELISPVIKHITDIVESDKRTQAAYKPQLGSLVGYIKKRSIEKEAKLDVFVHATEPYSVQIFRLGRQKVLYRNIGNYKSNPQDALYSPDTGFDSAPSFSVDTSSYSSGIYLVEMKGNSSGALWQIPFIVKPKTAPKIAFILSTYTWYAFNAFAGKNFYIDHETSGDSLAYNNALDSLLNSIGLPKYMQRVGGLAIAPVVFSVG